MLINSLTSVYIVHHVNKMGEIEMISFIFTWCVTAVVTALLLALAMILLVFIVYAVATIIRIAVNSYKDTVELDKLSDEIHKHE